MCLENKNSLAIVVLLMLSLSGCATYRNSSNVDSSGRVNGTARAEQVTITEGTPQGKYVEAGFIEISIKKLTVFNADPTRDQANELLREKARAIGADAVIQVKYMNGIGLTTWGYLDAQGIGVKMAPNLGASPANTELQSTVQTKTDPAKKIRELNELLSSGKISQTDYDKRKSEILSGM